MITSHQLGGPLATVSVPTIGPIGGNVPEGKANMRKQKKLNNRTREQRLNYYIMQQKRDIQKTLGKLEYLKRFEPDVYRKLMDKGL